MEDQFIDSMREALKLLHWTGLNPYRQNVFSKIRTLIMFLSLIMAIYIHIPQIINDFDGTRSFQKIPYFADLIMALFKLTHMTLLMSSIYELLERLQTFWPINKFGEESETHAKKCHNYCFQFHKVYLYIVIFNMVIAMIPCITKRILLFPYLGFCDKNVWPCYEVQQAWHMCLIFCQILPLFVGCDVMFLSFVTYIYVALDITKLAFTKYCLIARNQNDFKTYRENMSVIVTQHNVVINFIRKLDKLYSTYFLFHFWSASLSLIFCLYMFTANGLPKDFDHITFGILWLSIVYELTLFSIGGTIIYEQTESIANAAYDVEWYRLGQTTLREDLSFIIQRARRVERIRVGNMFDLNLHFLANAIRFTLSINMLIVTVETNKH